MAASDDAQDTFDQLCAFIETRMQQTGVPGVAIGILHEGQTYTAGFGVTSIDHPLPVTDEDLLQIGSISKTFTCLAVMRLIELGKLDLHATVRTYIPDFRVVDKTASEQATLWHLLTHTSGWAGDLFEDTGAGDDTMAKYMALMADQEQLAPIGLESREPEPIEASEKELAAYVGLYTRPLADIELGMLCGCLVGQIVYKHGYPSQSSVPRPPPPPMLLALCEEDRLLVMSGPRTGGQVEIIRKPDGTIGWLREHDRIYLRKK